MKLNSSKWIIELNIRTTTVKLRRNIAGKFLDISIGHSFVFFFLYLTLKARTTREREKKKKAKNKCDYIKLISLCMAKEAINKMKRQPTE